MSQPELDALRPESRQLFEAWPVRKGAKRKAAFRAELCAILERDGWPVAVEGGGSLVKTNNVVAGDIGTADIIFTAHYDTPARLPFPNFIAPCNLAATLAYQLLLALAICLPGFFVPYGLRQLGAPPLAALLGGLAVLLLLLWLLLAGPANPHNANDNTSGVLTLVELAAALPAGLRGRAALVFFDNEELGLVGSGALRAKRGALGKKLVVNFDCVGVGGTLLFVPAGPVRRNGPLCEKLKTAFGGAGKNEVLVTRSPLALYPSDQMMFRQGVGVVACRRAPAVGLYVSRIHTARDTLLWQQNLLQLCNGAVRLVEGLAPGQAPPRQ